MIFSHSFNVYRFDVMSTLSYLLIVNCINLLFSFSFNISFFLVSITKLSSLILDAYFFKGPFSAPPNLSLPLIYTHSKPWIHHKEYCTIPVLLPFLRGHRLAFEKYYTCFREVPHLFLPPFSYQPTTSSTWWMLVGNVVWLDSYLFCNKPPCYCNSANLPHVAIESLLNINWCIC